MSKMIEAMIKPVANFLVPKIINYINKLAVDNGVDPYKIHLSIVLKKDPNNASAQAPVVVIGINGGSEGKGKTIEVIQFGDFIQKM